MRGLNIPDREKAKHYLKFIGYYRLSGYCLPFKNTDTSSSNYKSFKEGITFDNILNLYIFDRKLRLLVMDAIERIEIAVKASISNTMSEQYDSHWFINPKYFTPEFEHDKFLELLNNNINPKNKKREIFIEHYYSKYSSPNMPPSWMVFEILSFGIVSNIFKFLDIDSRKKIANNFGWHYKIMESWIHSLCYIRNLCAHHCRIWNRIFTIKPKKAKKYKEYLSENDKFYAQAVVIEVFLQVIAEDTHWSKKLKNLFQEYPSVSIEEMGFPLDWDTLPFWQNL